jgi:chromosome segregation ATPase
MLNAAAIVVFVNKVQPLQPALDAKQTQLDSAHSELAAARANQQHAEEQVRQQISSLDNARSASAAATAELQKEINSSKVEQARLQADNTNLQSALNTAISNAQLATTTSKTLQDQLNSIRTANDTLAKQNDEFSRRNAELTSTLDNVKSSLDQNQERLASAKDSVQKLSAALKDKGYDPESILNTQLVTGPGAPAINGVVREKQIINGNTFVTISVGSADQVTKGMKFNVFDGATFLGIVTIDTVDTDNSIGRLDGDPDRVSQVHQGDEVKTQIRS